MKRRSARRAGAPRRAGRRAPRGPQSGGEREVVIEALGARGDGIARLDDLCVFVPLTLPGDRLAVRLGAPREGGFAAEPLVWHEQVPRAAPRCPHFGACGGCQLQHLGPAADAAWQCAQVANGARPARPRCLPDRAAGADAAGDPAARPPRLRAPRRKVRARLSWPRRACGGRRRRLRGRAARDCGPPAAAARGAGRSAARRPRRRGAGHRHRERPRSGAARRPGARPCRSRGHRGVGRGDRSRARVLAARGRRPSPR